MAVAVVVSTEVVNIHIIIIICVVVVIGLVLFRLTFGNFKIRYDNFTIFQGMLGSGKTTLLSYMARKELRRRKLFNFIRTPMFVILFFIPIIHIIHLVLVFKEKRTKNKWNYFKKYSVEVYSNYPIKLNTKIFGFFLGKPKYSICIDYQFFTYNYKILEESIVVVDELQYLLPNTKEGKAIVSDERLKLCLTYLRHCTNCCFFGATQSFGEINITFRRKVNFVYELSNMRVKKFLIFLPSKVYIRQLNYSEDITTGNITTDENIQEGNFYFYFPRNVFDSRYCKFLYGLESDELIHISKSYNNLIDYCGCEVGKRFKENSFTKV